MTHAQSVNLSGLLECYTDLNKVSDLTSVLLFGATVNGDLLRDKYVRRSALQVLARI